MPMASVTLRPGVNTERTLALNEAGVSISNLIRYKDQLIQKIGGWQLYYPLTIASTIRDIHGWQGLTGNKYLAVGATGSLNVITNGSNNDITPQTRTSDFTPNFSVSSGSAVVTVTDPGSSASLFDTVYFNTPVAVGGILLSGAYPINTVGGSSSYTVVAANVSSVAVVSSGLLPLFNTTVGTATVDVQLPNNNYQQIPGLFYNFTAPTTVGGLTIQGPYQVSSILNSTEFTITATNQAASTATQYMNGNLAEVVYYIAQGPPSAGGGYGLGGYGLGGYGMGSGTTSGGGTPITTTDWTTDNWGESLLACPVDGAIYAWSANSGYTTASVVSQAPLFNGGIFVSMPQQILVAWRSTQSTGVQDPLTVRWSDAGDYTNWAVTSQTTAGSFHIPRGSKIMGGLQAPTQGVVWTDIECWTMQYVGGDVIFNFQNVGAGCGLIGPHAAGVLNGEVYWCGTNNFFILGDKGVQVVPCPVWDFIFQNLDTANQTKIRCAPNSTFNEISWFFPVYGGTGENTAYVKYNRSEGEWDYGFMSRNAWIDVTALGNPIGTDTQNIFQHEMTNDAAGQPINGAFQSGYWSISEGNDLAFVDWVLPDMKFGTYSGAKTAQLQVTFYATDYPGDTPRTYGPYTYQQSTEFINTRIRGRFMAIRIESNDLGSFWRLGRVKYRWAPIGRR